MNVASNDMQRLAPAISKRHILPEIMDQPDLDALRHAQALDGLARLNRFSRSAAALWQPIHALSRRETINQISILDVACGSGDNLIRIAGLARRSGVSVDQTGCDISQQAVEHATKRSASAKVQVAWRRHDIISHQLEQTFDVVLCSLFVHHLARDQQIRLLHHLQASARRMIIIADLQRCLPGYVLAWIASRTLTRSDVVHTDALRSVRAALTIDEARRMFAQAGMDTARVRRCWPHRWVAVWNRGSQ